MRMGKLADRGSLPAPEWVFPQETIQLKIDGVRNTKWRIGEACHY